MKYTPTDFDSSVNVSNRKPVREFLQYLLSITIVLTIGYYMLGRLVDFSVSRISPDQEDWLWERLNANGAVPDAGRGPAFTEAEKYLQTLIDKVPENFYPVRVRPRMRVIDEEDINAFAFPGGSILVTKGLLKNVETENGLMFILGHEIGHFMARDQIRSMGRALSMLVATTFLFGQDSATNDLVSTLFSPIRNKFSQQQENAADEWGLKVLKTLYGHSSGSHEFFQTILRERSENRYLDAFSTHPLSEDRIEHMRKLAAQMGLMDKDTIPVKKFF